MFFILDFMILVMLQTALLFHFNPTLYMWHFPSPLDHLLLFKKKIEIERLMGMVPHDVVCRISIVIINHTCFCGTFQVAVHIRGKYMKSLKKCITSAGALFPYKLQQSSALCYDIG